MEENEASDDNKYIILETDVQANVKLKTDGVVQELLHPALLFQSPPSKRE